MRCGAGSSAGSKVGAGQSAPGGGNTRTANGIVEQTWWSVSNRRLDANEHSRSKRPVMDGHQIERAAGGGQDADHDAMRVGEHARLYRDTMHIARTQEQ